MDANFAQVLSRIKYYVEHHKCINQEHDDKSLLLITLRHKNNFRIDF